ncbi:MAG: hypothetical protein ACHP65_10030 [Legionellales bacterium]
MIKSRNIDFKDIHKLVQVPIYMGAILSDGSATVQGTYIVPSACVLAGAQIMWQSQSGTNPTLDIEIEREASEDVLLDTGAIDVSATGSGAARFAANGNSPASESQLDSMIALAAGDVLQISDTVGGSSTPEALGVTVVLEFQ